MTSPRILLITRNLPPLVGGMERLNWHMAHELSKQADLKVVGPKGAEALMLPPITLAEAPLKPLPLFLLISFFKGLRIAYSMKPDVIIAGSGLTAPIVWLLSKLSNSRSSVYLHGFDITVDNTLYRKLWRPTFKNLDHVIVNSTPTKELAIAAGVCQKKIRIVNPGASLPNAPRPAENILEFKAKNGLQGKKILLSVGRLTTRKGLREFVEHALPVIVKAEPETMLVIIGEAPKNSLGARVQSVESIQTQAKKSGVTEHIKFLGVITDKHTLATAYEAADIHVFPVRHIPDDPEGFGMVAIEAAAHGLPTVAFATGGIVDAVHDNISGYLVEKGNYSELSKKILEIFQEPMASESIYKFASKFSWERFGQEIYSALTHA